MEYSQEDIIVMNLKLIFEVLKSSHVISDINEIKFGKKQKKWILNYKIKSKEKQESGIYN